MGLGNEEMGRLFGGLHYRVVSKAPARVTEVMATDRKLEKMVTKLDSHFKAPAMLLSTIVSSMATLRLLMKSSGEFLKPTSLPSKRKWLL